MTHLTVECIVDGLEGRLDDDAMQALRAHVSSCALCFDQLSRYGGLLDAMQVPPIVDAPDPVLQRALAIFDAPQQPRQSVAEVLVDLIFDSWAVPQPGGMRSSQGARHSRQLGMSVGDFELHLSVDYTSHYVRGQLLRRSGENFDSDFEVRLLDRNSNELADVSANVLGEFVIQCDPQYAAWLVMYLPDGTNMRIQLPSMSGD